MAPQVGFEPTTDRLTADCSTTELLRKVESKKIITLKKNNVNYEDVVLDLLFVFCFLKSNFPLFTLIFNESFFDISLEIIMDDISFSIFL